MMTTGTRVLIDANHQIFGGQSGIIRWIRRQPRNEQYVVTLDGSHMSYEFTSRELLVP